MVNISLITSSEQTNDRQSRQRRVTSSLQVLTFRSDLQSSCPQVGRWRDCRQDVYQSSVLLRSLSPRLIMWSGQPSQPSHHVYGKNWEIEKKIEFILDYLHTQALYPQ